MTVRQAQRQVSSREYAQWAAYYELEPYGEDRADLRAGIIASTMYNVHRGRGQRRAVPRDFMPRFGPPRRQPLEEMIAVAKQFATMHNRHQQQRRALPGPDSGIKLVLKTGDDDGDGRPPGSSDIGIDGGPAAGPAQK